MSKRAKHERITELSRRVEKLEQIAQGHIDHAFVGGGSTQHLVCRLITVKGETFYQDIIIPGRRCRTSIDASTGDDGFLGSAFTAYQGSINANSVDRHYTTAQAFAKVQNGSADYSIIVGHGVPGIISTGSGQQVTDGPDKYMSLLNETAWNSIASQGVPGSRLVLFACNVALGQDGADFIQAVANVVRKEVGAWDGLVTAGVQNGLPAAWGTGNFRTASPGGRVAPVEPPEFFRERDQRQVIRMRIADAYENLSYDAVRSVAFTPIGNAALRGKQLTAEKGEVGDLLKLIDFSRPIVFADKLASILVGQLTITFEHNKILQMRTFRVLGYSVLQDACFTNTYYYALSKLRGALQTE